MDGHRHEGLSDEALEREIEAALGVDPSPEFLPRVRARIANERVQAGWVSSASWRWAGAVAVVTAVAVIGLWTLRNPVPAPREVRITPTAETTTPFVERARPEPAPVAPRSGRAAKRVSAPVEAPFEVVISQEEAVALRRLFTAIGNRRIETRALPDLTTALRPPSPIDEIVLDPIIISPLAALEGE
jgi:hypothetical protein